MAPRLVFAVLIAMVIHVVGEQLLRGQPNPQGGTLATEVAEPSRGSQALLHKPNKQKNVISFFRGMLSDPQDDEFIRASDFKEFGFMNSGEIFVSFLIWLVFYSLIAAYYHNYVLFYPQPGAAQSELEKIIDYEDFKVWKSGLFDCSKEKDICFWSCCCPGIRWADTMSKLNIHRFWPAFWLLTGLMMLSWIPVCTLFCHFILVSYFVFHRQEFRKKFEFTEQGQSVCFKDCCIYLFCVPCAVAQEARHSRDACIVKHPAIDFDHATPRRDTAN